MKQIVEILQANPQVSGYKINIHQKESYELFFVKGSLETVRCTDTCDKEVTVYAQHGKYMGNAQFFVYPSTTADQLAELTEEAVQKALLINNPQYSLPGQETGEYTVASNFAEYSPAELAGRISELVFQANQVENGSLNSVEVFINKHTESVINSQGLHKTQTRYDAMVEAIPTYNGDTQSVELYEQYNFSNLDEDALIQEIAEKMVQVKARYEAVKPDHPLDCKVILNAKELSYLYMNIAGDLNYASVYSQSNLFKKGDPIQKDPTGDKLGLTMAGEAPGSVRSAKFDRDGLTLRSMRILDGGKAVNYYGSNRYGQYLGEDPTGELRCFCADAGTAGPEQFQEGAYLEVVSMSGLQVDFYTDYIGGEIRLAYYHDGASLIPVTGISISGQLSQVLSGIRLSTEMTCLGGYWGPKKGILTGMKIF